MSGVRRREVDAGLRPCDRFPGLGARDTWVRAPGGRPLAHYSARYFGLLTWETEKALLLDTNDVRTAATVRCVVGDCERAPDLRPVRTP